MPYLPPALDRQQLISQHILEYQHRQHQLLHPGNNDPFQIYYYPQQLAETALMEEMRGKIKACIDEQANMGAMGRIEGVLREELWMVEERVRAERAEAEALEGLIRQMEGMVQRGRAGQTRGQERREGEDRGTQTEGLKTKEVGVGCAAQVKEEKSDKNQKMYTSHAYSMNIVAPNTVASQSVAAPAIKIDIKKQNRKPNKQIKSKEEQSQEHFKTTLKMQHKPHRNRTIEAKNLDNINSELQKQMNYLQHLKSTDRKRQYREQKLKVKFLMELFWKNAPSPSLEQSFTLVQL